MQVIKIVTKESVLPNMPAGMAADESECTPTPRPRPYILYMWPPSSPDCNPLDFNVWGYVESKACANAHQNITALQNSVDKYWMELLTEEHVKKTCDSAWKRIRRMIQAKGNTFELEMKKKKNVPKPPVVGSEQQPPVSGAEEGNRQV